MDDLYCCYCIERSGYHAECCPCLTEQQAIDFAIALELGEDYNPKWGCPS